jgi:hypothetical protein
LSARYRARYGGGVRGVVVVLLVAFVVGCPWKRRPTYEYEPWVTTTSTAEPVPPPPQGAPSASTSTTQPSVWQRGERR